MKILLLLQEMQTRQYLPSHKNIMLLRLLVLALVACPSKHLSIYLSGNSIFSHSQQPLFIWSNSLSSSFSFCGWYTYLYSLQRAINCCYIWHYNASDWEIPASVSRSSLLLYSSHESLLSHTYTIFICITWRYKLMWTSYSFKRAASC